MKNIGELNSEIILIISDGHSGSTLLDLILGTLPGVMSTGELIWLPWQIFRNGKICTSIPKQDICTCLKTFKECPIWGSIIRDLSAQKRINYFDYPLKFDIFYLREKKFRTKISSKYSLIRKIMTKAIISNDKWLINAILNNQKESIYNTVQLYKNIARTVNASFISDSSKDILRAYAIWREIPQNTKVILLYKDAKSFAASGKHWRTKSSIKKRLEKWIHHYEKKYVPILRKMSACEIMTIKYDMITRDPNSARKNLGNFLGLDCFNSDWKINTKEMHIVAGNPMRFKGSIDIKYDERWRYELNSEEKEIAEYYEKKMEKVIGTF
jgi:hypothetical protein